MTREKNLTAESQAKASAGPAVLKLILTYSILGEGEFRYGDSLDSQILTALP